MEAQDIPFRSMLQEVAPKVFKYCMKLTRDPDKANDLMHDALLKALENEASFQPQLDKGQRTSMTSWLMTIAHNMYMNSCRINGRYVPVDPTVLVNLCPSVEAPPSLELRDACKAIDQLTVKLQTPLLLVIEGYSYQAIAQMLNLNIGTVRSRICRAREFLCNSQNYSTVRNKKSVRLTSSKSSNTTKRLRIRSVKRPNSSGLLVSFPTAKEDEPLLSAMPNKSNSSPSNRPKNGLRR